MIRRRNWASCFRYWICGLLALFHVRAFSEPAEELVLGRAVIHLSAHSVGVTTPDNSKLAAHVLPGGKYWPWLVIDETGTLSLGAGSIQLESGKPGKKLKTPQALGIGHGVFVVPSRISRQMRVQFGAARSCDLSVSDLSQHGKPQTSAAALLRDANILLSARPDEIVGLVTSFDSQGDKHYATFHLRPAGCKLTVSPTLGNLDLLVELGNTVKGGWWIVGSIEQTLLRSKDGLTWSAMPLPSGVYGLISAYASSADEVWLAAGIAPGQAPDAPLLLHTVDGGRTWASLRNGDPALHQLPRTWFEGQLRAFGKPIESSERRSSGTKETRFGNR